MERLSKQEEEAMQAVWKVGEGNVKHFLVQMEGSHLPYTTLASTLKNLQKKGYLSGRLLGNAYLYKAVISADEYKKMCMSGFVRDYFDNSYKDLVHFCMEEKKLSVKELKEIIEQIEREG